jgi:hypothetical protein
MNISSKEPCMLSDRKAAIIGLQVLLSRGATRPERLRRDARLSYKFPTSSQNAPVSDPGFGIAVIARWVPEAGYCTAKTRFGPGIEPLPRTNFISNYLNRKETHEFVADPYRHFRMKRAML